MDMAKREIIPGDIYLHDKGDRYQIIAIAEHTETGEKMVVYQNVESSERTFTSPIDVYEGKISKEERPGLAETDPFGEEEKKTDLLMEFLDAEQYSEKIAIFKKMKENIDKRLINNIAAALDVVLNEKPLEEQYEDLLQYMNTRAHFETRRLR